MLFAKKKHNLYCLIFMIIILGCHKCDSDDRKTEGERGVKEGESGEGGKKQQNAHAEAKPGGKNENLTKKIMSPVEMYQRLFRQKRISHKTAVKTIVDLSAFEKQYKMISMLLEKLFTVMSEARVKLMETGFTPGDPFPVNETIREAFSIVAENTAFFGDLLLRLPDITHTLLNKKPDWKITASWAVSFCNETQFFEQGENTLFSLMAQEMNLVERDPNYINPYREDIKLHLKMKELDEKRFKEKERLKKKEKKKKKRGPRLSHVEL